LLRQSLNIPPELPSEAECFFLLFSDNHPCRQCIEQTGAAHIEHRAWRSESGHWNKRQRTATEKQCQISDKVLAPESD